MREKYKILFGFCIIFLYYIVNINANENRHLFLLRHCETDWNISEKLQSISDISLNDDGVFQANQIACELFKNSYNIKYIFTSPLKRAKQTAEIIGKQLGLEPIIDSSFLPANAGKAIGMTPKEINEQFGVNTIEKWRSEDELFDNFSYPNGETKIEVRDRIVNKINLILDNTIGNIIIITHGFSLKQAIIGLGFREQKYNKGIKNGEIVDLLYNSNKSIIFLNRYNFIKNLDLE